MDKKKNYVSPSIEVVQIEVESSFAAGSVVKEEKSEVVSLGQEVGSEVDASNVWNDEWY